MKQVAWRLGLVGGGLALGMVLLVQGLAHLTWTLGEAGHGAPSQIRERPVEAHAREAEIGRHHVSEWDEAGSRDFQEAPQLVDRVAAGELPPVEQRLPRDPLVIHPPQQMGPYGGTWQRYAVSVGDVGVLTSRLSYDGLVRWSPPGEQVWPNLVRQWEKQDNARVYVMHLRRGVRWSDGEPFDADDVMFWYEHVLLNESLTPSVHHELRRGGEVVQLSKLDAHTLRFEFAEPHALFVERALASNLFQTMLVPRHYMEQFHKQTVEPAAGERREEGQLPAALRTRMAARGYEHWRQLYNYMNRWQNPERPTLRAWKLHRAPPHRPIVFVRNPYYWKVDPEGRQLPYIDRVSFQVFDVQIITLRAIEGRMDMQKRHLRFEHYPLLMQNRREGGYQVRLWQPGSGNDLVIAPNLNHRDPATRRLLHDARFRKALSLALDRRTMNQARYFGQAQPRQVAASSSSPFYDPAYASAYVEHDPARALELLEEIGLERRSRDGRWLGADGRLLRFQIDVTNTPSGGDAIVDLIAEAWTAIGIRTDINRLARSLWTQRRNALMPDFTVWEGEWEDNPVIQPRWYAPVHPYDGSMHAVEYARWFASDGKEGEEPEGDLRRVVDIYRQIERETDPQRRIELFQQISELNRKNLWVIGTLGRAPVPVVVHDDMRNVPDVALSSWEVRSPGNTATECYALDRKGD